MRTLIIIVLSFLTFGCTNKYKNIKNVEADYQIIPKPQSLKIADGRFLINADTKIVCSNILKNEGKYLQKMIRQDASQKILTEEIDNSIVLKIDTSIKNKEGYKLEIKYNKITILGSTSQGVFYGIQTLRQLMPASIEVMKITEFTIPAGTIEDSPRFTYRGMHLDVARHFFSVEVVKEYIDLIAMHKMNTFHWHLTEDQGWRIEIKKYPKLTEIGAYRDQTLIGRGSKDNKYDGKRYGGFYTQDQIKEIVAYATERHITVIPEIELPGHALAAIASYPKLGNTGKQYKVAERWGVFSEIYAPTEETFTFLENVLTEVIALFPSKYIHIGGDEAPKKQWKESKYAQKLIKEKGLENEHGLQSYFIGRIEKFLNSKGRDIIGWDEILEGGLAPNATVMSWRGTRGGIAAARQHHNVIMTPNGYCYFDYYQTKDTKNEPLAIGGNLPVKKVYSYEPMAKELSTKEQQYILGAQGNVWTEYIPTKEHLEYMILPRMSALSEVVWSSKKNKNWNDFNNRLYKLAERFDALGLNYAKHSLTK